MIQINGKEISLVFYGEKAVSTIRKGTRLVWQAVRSCFGAGYWVNEKPWINKEGWRN